MKLDLKKIQNVHFLILDQSSNFNNFRFEHRQKLNGSLESYDQDDILKTTSNIVYCFIWNIYN